MNKRSKRPALEGKLNRRGFITCSVLASAGLGMPPGGQAAAAAEASKLSESRPVAPGAKATLPTAKIGGISLSRLIAGGNLLSGWCHQRDLLFVRNLAESYLTKDKQFDTLQMLEEYGVNSMVVDMEQLGILNQYRQERSGQMKAVASVRQGWGNWEEPKLADLKEKIRWAADQGPSMLYLHGGYADRLVQSGKPERVELLGKALEFIRTLGFPAGLGSHALEVPKACDQASIQPDFYVKTFHHDRYWSATPKAHRKPFSVDGPRQLDHNEFHDNIFCLDAEGTAAYMLDKLQPWIAFKVLAAGAIHPESGFKYAFDHGADFIAVGMFDFEVAKDVEYARAAIKEAERERPWCV